MELLFVTGNKGKLAEIAHFLKSGGTEGFGYDPIFIPNGSKKSCLTASFLNRRLKSLKQRSCERISSESGKTWGAAPELKNISSHRKQAIEKLIKWLKKN